MASKKVAREVRVEEILLQAGVIDDLQLRSARARQATWGGRLTRSLVELGFATEEAITETLGRALNMRVTHLGTLAKDPAALAKLDVKYCEKHCVFPVGLRDRTLQLAMPDPTELDVVDEVQALAGVRVQPLLVGENEVLAAISRHYRNRELRPMSRGVRRFTDEAVPAAGQAAPAAEPEKTEPAWSRGASSHGQRTEQTFELDTSAPPTPSGAFSGPISGFTGPASRQPSANTMLDEMLDGQERTDLGFTRDELARLEAARQNQEKTTTILRALRELLAEKGFIV